ncbi:MAG: hypothetical protein HY812_06175 [Planctomycetes bacterium]|nr:hypothetical protein [Planctomycetota bacterium]
MRRRLASEPRPHAIAELARAYLGLGEAEVAAEVLQSGLSLFPASAELARVRLLVASEEKVRRLRAAKELVQRRPCPQAALELADAYRSLDRWDQHAQVLREALERYGENGTVLAQLGELRLHRFLESAAAADALAAEDLLRRALDVEPEALKPRLLLAELSYRVGGVPHARAQIARLLAIAPEHERAARLRDALEREQPGDAAHAEDFRSLLAEVEERMRLLHGRLPWEEETAAEDAAARERAPFAEPGAEAEALARISGAERVLLIDERGAAWGAARDGAFDAAVRDLAALCQRAARGMELGVPASLVVEGESGAFVLEMKRGALAGLALPARVDAGAAAVAARDALERLVRG